MTVCCTVCRSKRANTDTRPSTPPSPPPSSLCSRRYKYGKNKQTGERERQKGEGTSWSDEYLDNSAGAKMQKKWIMPSLISFSLCCKTQSLTSLGVYNPSLAGKIYRTLLKVLVPRKWAYHHSSWPISRPNLSKEKQKRPGPIPAQPCKVPDFWFSKSHLFVNKCLFIPLFVSI